MEQLTLKSKSGWTGFLTWLDSPDGWERWCRRPSRRSDDGSRWRPITVTLRFWTFSVGGATTNVPETKATETLVRIPSLGWQGMPYHSIPHVD